MKQDILRHFRKCKKSYLKFLIHIRINGTFLVHFHIHLASVQFNIQHKDKHKSVEQSQTCYQHKHSIPPNSKHLIKKSQIFRNVPLWPKSSSLEANVNNLTAFGGLGQYLVFLKLEQKFCWLLDSQCFILPSLAISTNNEYKSHFKIAFNWGRKSRQRNAILNSGPERWNKCLCFIHKSMWYIFQWQ